MRWGKKPPRTLGTTSLLDYAKDLEGVIAKLDQPPVLIGHSLGGLLARCWRRKARPRAGAAGAVPALGIMPSTLFEIASAQTIMLAGNLSNQILNPDYDVAAAHSLDRLPLRNASGCSPASCRIGPRDFRDHCIGAGTPSAPRTSRPRA